MMSVKFSPNALKQFFYIAERDKRLFKALKRIIDDTQRNGASGLGHPEPLKENLSGYWSREIDEKNRLIYKILENGNILIAHCNGHYGDK